MRSVWHPLQETINVEETHQDTFERSSIHLHPLQFQVHYCMSSEKEQKNSNRNFLAVLKPKATSRNTWRANPIRRTIMWTVPPAVVHQVHLPNRANLKVMRVKWKLVVVSVVGHHIRNFFFFNMLQFLFCLFRKLIQTTPNGIFKYNCSICT